jgi:glucose/arabinose dehydrogenase
MGKTLRIDDDGSVPQNNPFMSETTDATRHCVFSYGHRNHQAMVYDPKCNVIFSNEHGPDGGDELNIIQVGVNYGWSVITYGNDYIGGRTQIQRSTLGTNRGDESCGTSLAI